MTERKIAHSLVGRVLNCNMSKTIRVQVDRLVEHPIYGKYVRRTGKLLAHDEANECRVGDVVMVTACRPVSKRKVWKLERVLQRAES